MMFALSRTTAISQGLVNPFKPKSTHVKPKSVERYTCPSSGAKYSVSGCEPSISNGMPNALKARLMVVVHVSPRLVLRRI